MSQPLLTGKSGLVQQSSNPVRSHTVLTNEASAPSHFPSFNPQERHRFHFEAELHLNTQHNQARHFSHRRAVRQGYLCCRNIPAISPAAQIQAYILGGVLPPCGSKETTHLPPLQAPSRAAQQVSQLPFSPVQF